MTVVQANGFCMNCGKKVPESNLNQFYCSEQCRKEGWRRRNPEETEIREVRYLTDDRDDERNQNELVIQLGGNGDWYVSVVPKGQGTVGRGVRLATSGGASSQAPGLCVAIADAFRALIRSGHGR